MINNTQKINFKNSFEKFTNLYELSKTLRFELKPIGNTQKMLEENKVFEEDKNKKKDYEAIKPYFDRLHREFVIEALSDITLLGLKEYFDLFQKGGKDKKNAINIKKLDDKKKDLRKQVVSYFDATGKKWAEKKYAHLKIKQKNLNILFEKEIFGILKDRYGDEQGTQIAENQTNKKTGEKPEKKFSIFDEWSGFTGYFTKFHETRKNFYKNDGTATALATRIIDHNLDRFLENTQIFENIKSKIDISEVEEFFQKSAEIVFSFDFYNKCVLQNGIDEYNYFLGGKTLEDGTKKIGINEIINKYRQDYLGEKLSYLKKLDNQILSEKEKKIFVLKTDKEFIDVLKIFQKNAEVKISILQNLIKDFIDNESKYTLKKIYISKEAFNTISRRWTDETGVWEEKLFEILKEKKLVKSKKDSEEFSFPDFIALEYIKISLEKISSNGMFWKERYYIGVEDKKNIGFLSGKEIVWRQFLLILGAEFSALFNRVIENENGEKIDIGYSVSNAELQKILGKENILKDKISKIIIKNFADDVLRIYQMGKYFAVEKKRVWDDKYEIDDFYTKPEIGYLAFYDGAYKQIVQAYNDIRNYLTKKPYSEEKWKLNFENSTLANGWDKNKESANSSVILRKNGKYYLGLMKKGCGRIFDESKNGGKMAENSDNGFYEKMVYKLLPNPFTDLPHICFSAKGLDFFHPSDEILKIYKNGEFKKGDSFSLENMQKLIGFYKNCFTMYEGWKSYDFKNIKKSELYQNNIGEFYSDVAKAGYNVWFKKISEIYIEQKNKAGELYLFEIYNQDFADGKIGKKNLHTMYWEELFSENNMKEFPFKLNGQAEIFYRPKSIEVETEKRNFTRDIVKKERYAKNKIFFHCPITLNREKGKALRFNQNLNNFLAQNDDINIIGVDRGEKHLAYYSVIKQNGEVIESGSLNFIQSRKENGEIILKNKKEIEELRNAEGKIIEYRIRETGEKVNMEDYKLLLECKEKNRKVQRQSWDAVGNIKDLKKGYISQVVRKLADLAIKHNAIIVFEDLNMRFKQIRGGIEKSVYQQLEKALIEKLNFLVNKGELDKNKAGHLLKAYQLAAPIETFKDMGKQTGIIFYTQAAYTSKIDPVTGWRPNLYLKYTNAEKTKEDILKFSEIKFDAEKNRFEFTYDLKKFGTQEKYPTKNEWTLCSCVERFRWNKSLNQNKGGYNHYENLTKSYLELFKGLNLQENLVPQIAKLELKGNEKFFKDFIFFFGLLCQIRNTQKEKEGNENDFIYSPVEPFFDSRKSENFGKNLPKNGDDNGAYNIARKGIIILEKISKFQKDNKSCEKMNWGDLYVSHIDWDNFSQK